MSLLETLYVVMVKCPSLGAQVILETQGPVPAKAPFPASPCGRVPLPLAGRDLPHISRHTRALGGLNSSKGCDPYFVPIWLPKGSLLWLCGFFFFFFQKGRKDSPTFHLCLSGALAGVGVLAAGPLLVTEALGPSPE